MILKLLAVGLNVRTQVERALKWDHCFTSLENSRKVVSKLVGLSMFKIIILNEPWCIFTSKLFSVKAMKLLAHKTAWVNLQSIMFKERCPQMFSHAKHARTRESKHKVTKVDQLLSRVEMEHVDWVKNNSQGVGQAMFCLFCLWLGFHGRSYQIH